MYLDLSGRWKLELNADSGLQTGEITLPGSLQGAGYGNPITVNTPWVSGLHDAFWYEQEPFKRGDGNECRVPFLCQPVRHFIGEAVYERKIELESDIQEDIYLYMELTRWRTGVWIDGVFMGEDCSLCTAHEINCGRLSAGTHTLRVTVDNSMQYPYRPDGHGVSDALGATWNGIAGEIALISESELQRREDRKLIYAKEHPRRMEVKEGNFYADGHPIYFRATHFGGDYPMTGYPETDKAWWKTLMQTIKSWGLNAVRCHSYCPPEAAFQAADEEKVFLLIECGMWNIFREGIPMLDVLRQETGRILKQFGHHPSFAFFSPSNEPGGKWHQPLKEWVKETKAFDRELGYEGRRLYTAQSGWFYDTPPKDISGTDFIYFHRSNYGPVTGGSIRNSSGWKGKDHSPSLEGTTLPVICHELGQWCAYPDFSIIEKMNGYLRPRNFEIFKEIAEENGVLSYEKDFLWCSGRNQLRLYKEELEANFRTPEIKGFELLDMHDYAGQGTALVGFLDVLWENKGYADPEEFKSFCQDTVLLTRISSYVWKNTDVAEIPVEISHFGERELLEKCLNWRLTDGDKTIASGVIQNISVPCGCCQQVGNITLDFLSVKKNSLLTLELTMGEVKNSWQLAVFVKTDSGNVGDKLLYTREWEEAKKALSQGRSVVYAPHLSELSYECPALSIKNIFWNGQMGPAWIRNLGILVNERHPIFRSFPTARDGGWQWEDILDHARGFWLKDMENVEPVVRPIDDWNRSLSLGLMYEAKVGQGRLFMVSADLEGSFEDRPAAYCLKQAILKYAASEDLEPCEAVSWESIEEKMFPVLRMEQLAGESLYDDDAKVLRSAETEANPNTSTRIEREAFPVTITLVLKRQSEIKGLLYLPEQKDRKHEGFIKDYRLEYFEGQSESWKLLEEGTLLNTSLSQTIDFETPVIAKELKLTVLSCYGCVEKTVWTSSVEGWIQKQWKMRAVVQTAGLHVICEERLEASDEIFWKEGQKSSTKEIDN